MSLTVQTMSDIPELTSLCLPYGITPYVQPNKGTTWVNWTCSTLYLSKL